MHPDVCHRLAARLAICAARVGHRAVLSVSACLGAPHTKKTQRKKYGEKKNRYTVGTENIPRSPCGSFFPFGIPTPETVAVSGVSGETIHTTQRTTTNNRF
jgi:hypothetical protein